MHQFLFVLTFANSMLIFCTFVNIHVVLRYLWNPKYSFRHSWIKNYLYFLLKSERLWPVLQLEPACKSLHCVMPHQHWTVNYMFIARGWVLSSLQGEYWKILALGTGLENLVSRERIGQYCSASRDGHQIHPRRVERIDSVKINSSLLMMREWTKLVRHHIV